MNYDEAKRLEQDLTYGGYKRLLENGGLSVEERGEGNWVVVLYGDRYTA